MNHIELGQKGEEAAVIYLTSKGHQIIDRNYRWKKYEVDIISLFDGKLVVTEVKTRQTGIIGEPYKAVTLSKQRQIIKATNQYIQEKDRSEEVRFDVISIVDNSFGMRLEHIEDAFYPLV